MKRNILYGHLTIMLTIMLTILCSKNVEAKTDHGEDILPIIIQAVEIGNWTNALQLTESSMVDDPKNCIYMLIEDTARLVLMRPKRPTRTSYDYPYSDKATCEKMIVWTQDLLVNNPTNTNYLLLNGILYLKGFNDFGKGIDRLEKVLKSDPNNVFALSALGACYGSQNRLDEAVIFSERAHNIDPLYAKAYSNLGCVAMSRGDRSKAEKYFQKEVTCHGADAMSWCQLGTLQISEGQLLKGKKNLLKGLEISPNLMTIHWNLACVYYKLGEKLNCIKECKKVIELAPDSIEGQKAKKNLQAFGV